MQLIEFCGAPGVGKTTLMNACIAEFRKQGYKVRRLAKNERPVTFFQTVGNCVRRKARQYSSSIYIRLDKTSRDYLSYVSAYPESIRYSKRLLRTLFCLRMTRKRSYDFLFSDESFIQNATSVVHDKHFTDEELETLSSFLNHNVYDKNQVVIVYCYLDMTETVNRINQRNRKADRFRVGTEQEIRQRLKVKISNIEELIRKVNCSGLIYCDTENCEECVRQIVSDIRTLACNENHPETDS